MPKSANEVKLISSGKILENNKTVGQCKVPFGETPGGVIIMHVWFVGFVMSQVRVQLIKVNYSVILVRLYLILTRAKIK